MGDSVGPGVLRHLGYYSGPLSALLSATSSPAAVTPEWSFWVSALLCTHQSLPFSHGTDSHCDVSSTYLLLGDPLSWALSTLGFCPSCLAVPKNT